MTRGGAFVFGAIGGGIATGLAWLVVSRAIDRQFASEARDLVSQVRPDLEAEIRAELDREVPPRVEAELRETLAEYGLTPDTGRRIDTLLSYADRIGLLGVPR